MDDRQAPTGHHLACRHPKEMRFRLQVTTAKISHIGRRGCLADSVLQESS